MAETVYILGAGASRHMNAPLMTDFIDRIEAVYEEFGSKVSIRDFERVIKLVHSDLPQLAARSVVDLGNIESVFGLVEMAKLIGRLPGVSPGDDAQAHPFF